MDSEGQSDPLAQSSHRRVERLGRHRCTTLADEYELAGRLLATKSPQRADLVASQRVHARCAVLESSNVQSTGVQLDLVPLEVAELGRSEPVTVGEQDHRAIAVPVAIPAGGIHQPIDLGLGQVLPWD